MPRSQIMSAYPKILSFLALVSLIYHFAFPQYAWADLKLIKEPQFRFISQDSLPILHGQALIQSTRPYVPITVESRLVIVTAYSSTPDQTDSTPFITASGTYVKDGIVASNFLKFGTLVRFPEIYGDKIFVVEDRMAPKNSHKIDIWFPEHQLALNFGVKRLKVEILKN